MARGGVIERLSLICSNVGFDLRDVDADVLSRLELLAERSQTVADLERMATLAFGLFRYYDANRPHELFDELEQRTIVLGCLFSDIGKTGPKRATGPERQLIVDMFSVEAVEDVMQPVRTFMARYFPDDADERVHRFEALGLDADMPMRALWNLHTSWTLEIIDGAGVPAEAVAAAATHHLLDDINPESIVGADDRFTRGFGANTCFDRSEKLVIILDKYDALRRRGRLSHAKAVAWLRERLENNARFRGDRELETLIADIDVVAGARAVPSS
ncbi:MAG: hypothetical protein R3B40_18375 [Polyangiales bacterium]|nr:hypothetical protein [Myxococcales bacterium]MCB9658490.1 hypothetical protein [Sandaracinaceae bacterium]